jgi:hypothetical protein
VFTARYALSPYIKQTGFVFKGLMLVIYKLVVLANLKSLAGNQVISNCAMWKLAVMLGATASVVEMSEPSRDLGEYKCCQITLYCVHYTAKSKERQAFKAWTRISSSDGCENIKEQNKKKTKNNTQSFQYVMKFNTYNVIGKALFSHIRQE